jgi:Protein of unknown function (DUF3501)
MKPIERGEILGLSEYERIRDPFRARVLAEKKNRYVALGSNMTVLFENRDTVLLQIQEMLRTERITQEKGILHEIETYNELVPGDRELSATVFIEYTNAEEREQKLREMAGIATAFSLGVAGAPAKLVPDARDTDPSRTMAVHYVKFRLSAAQEKAFRAAGVPVILSVDHPAYRAEIEISGKTLQSLRDDLG